jgi:hypothetical protein
LVVYISYVWLISLFYVGNALGIKAPGCIDGRYIHRQKRKEVSWPEIPQDFDGWALKKRSEARVILCLGCKEEH